MVDPQALVNKSERIKSDSEKQCHSNKLSNGVHYRYVLSLSVDRLYVYITTRTHSIYLSKKWPLTQKTFSYPVSLHNLAALRRFHYYSEHVIFITTSRRKNRHRAKSATYNYTEISPFFVRGQRGRIIFDVLARYLRIWILVEASRGGLLGNVVCRVRRAPRHLRRRSHLVVKVIIFPYKRPRSISWRRRWV